MDPNRFQSPEFGQASRELGNRFAFWYFKPNKIPREIELSQATISSLSRADAALGHLQGIATLLSQPQLLVGPYLTREAVASSRIEGTQASLSDVLQSEASETPTTNEDIAEVERYIAAAQQGYALIKELPISQRLILQVHKTLLQGVRGEEKMPGELRVTPVWVGSPTDTPDTAVYVPPIPSDIPDLLSDWERYVNYPNSTPTLIQCALMHYQFETIHPFLDGNGRIGRLLINLMLMQENRLAHPLLYLSGYLESHRDEYYDRLQAVREKGEIQEWMQFFLTAVEKQSEDAVSRARELVQLRERYIAEAIQTRSKLPGLVTLLFSNPYVTVRRIERALDLTNQGARNLIRQAETRGWLTEVGSWGRGGKTYWVANEVLDVIEAPMNYGEPDAAPVDDSEIPTNDDSVTAEGETNQ